MILDVRLPDGHGRDILGAKLRQQGATDTRIIMLTGSDGKTDVARDPDSGANVIIAKPFRLNELLAPLPAQVRAFEDSADADLVPPHAPLVGQAARGRGEGSTHPAHRRKKPES